MPAFDTDGIRRDNPLSAYLPTRGVQLKPNGREWHACCPFHAEKTPSFQVYTGRNGIQQFKCQGCGVSGDVIGFVERHDNVSFEEACRILGGERDAPESRPERAPLAPPPDVYAAWVPAKPPKGTPGLTAGQRTPPLENPKRDKPARYTPTLVHRYNHADRSFAGYVLRVDIDGKKLTPLIQWCENTETGEVGWCHRPFVGPRPLYRLVQLIERPRAQVLVVEGEKAADAAQRLWPGMAVVTWQGGAKAAAKSDWSPASGRDMLIWPDADPEGETAAQEVASLAQAAGASRVRIIAPPAGKAKGWDLADAEAEGWTVEQVKAHARAGAQEAGQPRRTPDPEPQPPEDDERRFDVPPDDRDGERSNGPTTRPALKSVGQEKPQEDEEHNPRPSAQIVQLHKAKATGPDWREGLQYDAHERVRPKIFQNWKTYLGNEPSMRGVFVFDAFRSQVIVTRAPTWERDKKWKARPLKDADARKALMYLERAGMTPSVSQAGQAIMAAAEEQTIDPVRDYFEKVARQWDGKPRLFGGENTPCWLVRYMGVRPSESGIEAAFGARWLIGAAARNLTENEDGEQVHNVLIFESGQGVGKTTALRALATLDGTRFFISGINDFSSKDNVQKLQGHLIVELDEMVALKREDVDVSKGFITRDTDEIRLPYAANMSKLRRRFIFAATMNPQGRGYLTDSTGGRRYWPVRIQDPIDLEALTRDTPQLWGEAAAHYLAGEQWHLTDEEEVHARREQKKRYRLDAWAYEIDKYLATKLGEAADYVTVSEIFNCIGIMPGIRDDAKQDRILSHLQFRDWQSVTVQQDGRPVHAFKRPKE